VNWARGQEIVLRKYPGYYKPGKPALDEIHFAFTADDDTRVNALRSGDVDIIEYVPWKDIPTLKANPNIRIVSTVGPFMMLQLNTHFAPFSHPEVRQAISYAINRSVIIDTAFNGVGTPIYGLAIPKGYLGYDPANDNYFSYDPAKAKELLAKAGFPNGFKMRLLSTAQYGYHMNTAIAVKQELSKIGIDCDLDLPDWAGRAVKNNAGNYDAVVAGTAGDITDPDWLSNFFYGGQQLVRMNNSPYFDDPEINRLLDEGRTTLDEGARARIYEAFAKRALELSPFVFLMWRDQSYAMKSTVSGFTNLPGFLSFQSGYSLENTQVK
jgi:glutathione transport system substrate-binding protein